MSRTPYLVTASLAGLFLYSVPAVGQSAPSAGPHSVIVKLVNKGGSMPYGFEPSNVTVQRGDTLRFVEDAGVMHNVHFKKHPSSAKLGTAAVGPFLTSKGQTYDIVIDTRFTDGTYAFVCDPHEMIGMHGTLTVAGDAAAAKGAQYVKSVK